VLLYAFADLVKRSLSPGPPGNIGLMTDRCAEMSDFDLRRQVLPATAPQTIDEILGVSRTAVSFVLVCALTVIVIKPTAAARNPNRSRLKLYVITAA